MQDMEPLPLASQMEMSWYKQLKEREHGALGGLLLTLLPNLVDLDVRALGVLSINKKTSEWPLATLFSFAHKVKQRGWTNISGNPCPIPRRTIYSLGNLSQVTRLRIESQQASILALRFPKLEVLEVEWPRLAPSFKMCVPEGCEPRNLKTLILRHDTYPNRPFRMDPEQIAYFLRELRYHEFTSLELLVSYGAPWYTESGKRNCQKYIEELGDVYQSLESLRIDIVGPKRDNAFEVDEAECIFEDIGPLELIDDISNPLPLQNWHPFRRIYPHAVLVQGLPFLPRLRKLEIIYHGLIHREMTEQEVKGQDLTRLLPATLEHLTIYWPDAYIIPWLENLFSCLYHFNMKRIELCCRLLSGKSASWFESREFEVVEKLRRSGVVVSTYQEYVELVRKKEVQLSTSISVEQVEWEEYEGWGIGGLEDV